MHINPIRPFICTIICLFKVHHGFNASRGLIMTNWPFTWLGVISHADIDWIMQRCIRSSINETWDGASQGVLDSKGNWDRFLLTTTAVRLQVAILSYHMVDRLLTRSSSLLFLIQYHVSFPFKSSFHIAVRCQRLLSAICHLSSSMLIICITGK